MSAWASGAWANQAWYGTAWYTETPAKPFHGGGGVSRARHIAWAPIEPREKRPLTKAEEQELVTLVRKAIDEDDLKARKRLEALAKKYADFQNSLASFAEAFQAMSETNRKRFEQHRITALAYMKEKEEIEEEETIILHMLRTIH